MTRVSTTRMVGRVIGLAGCVSIGLANSALADWQPELLSKNGEQYRSPDAKFEIRIPADVSVAILQRLALELDNVDVTPMVSREGDLALFKPLSPLAPGKHELRIVEYLADGSVIERGYWKFDVRQSRLFQKYSAGADMDLAVTYRLKDNNLSEPAPDRVTTSGSISAGFDGYNEDLHTSGQIGLNYNSLNTDSGEPAVELGDFQVGVENNVAQAKLGHQQFAASNLLISDFNRRGISGSYYLDNINSKASGFSFSSESLLGAKDGLGIGDSRHRVDGVYFESSPLKSRPRALYLTATWLSGEGTGSSGAAASSFGTLDTTSKGTGIDLSVDSQLVDEKLWLHGEYAATDFDFDTSDSLGAEKDAAWALSGQYGDTTESGHAWSVGLELKKVGTFYKSLANFSQPVDKKLFRAFGNYQWAEFSVQANLESQQDNVENIEILPTVETRSRNISLSWLPQFEEQPAVGYPSLNFTYFNQTKEQIETPLGYLYANIDNTFDQYQLDAQFSHTKFNWRVGLTLSESRDKSGVTTDNNVEQYDISGTYIVNQDISIPMGIKQSNTSYVLSDYTQKTEAYNLGVNFALLSGDLTGNAGFSLNKSSDSYNTVNTSLSTYTLGMTWHWIKAAQSKPGLDISLDATFTDNQDKVDSVNNLSTNQIMLTLRTTLPIHVGQVQ